jgi:hypothetical protein
MEPQKTTEEVLGRAETSELLTRFARASRDSARLGINHLTRTLLTLKRKLKKEGASETGRLRIEQWLRELLLPK